MSVNQSRGDKNEPPQYRKSGRSGNPASQRNFSGGGGGGKGGGGGSTTAPPSSSFYSGKSFKKVVSNAPQGAQTRVTGPNPNVNFGSSNSSTVGRTVQNGAHIQPPLRGTPDASTGAIVKPSDASVQKSTPGLPKAPQSNTIGPSGATGPTTPAKGPTDASKGFPLQFGSISPGVMNGMQVPARTNSAPPNLDEQKRAQARLESLKGAAFQNVPIPKQHTPRKDVVDQSNVSTGEPHSTTKEKKDVMIPSHSPVSSHIQKPTGPPMPSIPGVSMQMPFHQPQLHLQFGGPNPQQLQSQGITNTSMPLQLPMHLNPPQVPQQVFVPGIQHHPMSSQGIMNFSNPMGPQIGNMGMGLGPQYPQQQMGNFGGQRRTVKITHPETHEELRLDKRNDGFMNGGPAGPRGHPHGPPPQAFQPPPHPMNYYQNSYNPSPLFFQPPGNVQTASGSQQPRFYNQHVSKQVTVKPAVVSTPGEKVGDTSASDKSEALKVQKTGGEGTSTHPRKDSESITVSKPLVSSAPSEDSTSLVNIGGEVEKKATVNKAGSFKEEVKQVDQKPQSIPLDKVGGQSSSVLSSTVEPQGSILTPSIDVAETSNVLPATDAGDVSKSDNNKEVHNSTEVVESGTSSDNSTKIEEPLTTVGLKEPEEEGSVGQSQSQHSTIPDSLVTPDAQEKEKENVDNVDDKSEVDVLSAKSSSLDLSSSTHGEKISSLDDKDAENADSKESVKLNEESHSVAVSKPLTLEVEASVNNPLLETSKSRANTPKGKKKIKEILKNADARGSTSDLYNAYKRPEEKKESLSAENVESSQVASVDSLEKDEKGSQSKFEPDDWEDAADISTPKIVQNIRKEDNDGMTKKYSRDFLLKFSDQFTDLPEGFEITNDISEALIGKSGSFHRELSFPSPGRGGGGGGGDRAAAGGRLDRRPSNVGEEDKWNKGFGPTGGQPRLDMNFRGVNHGGVLRTPRPQGGILSGPMQSPGQQGGMPRNNSDSDRWQHRSGYQRGLMPSPQTPMPVMHKAERKYEVGKITDEEQAKQRRLKGILNKLTPQNFEKLFEQVKEVNIDNAGTLSGVIAQIFDKALMEPTFVEMYANFCSRLSTELPDFSEDNEKITFKRLLLNKCQEEFERGEREEEEANRTEEEGEVKQTEEQREEKRVKARRRMLGNIRLIGELYKKKMLTERIMHECIKKLLGQHQYQSQNQNIDEEDIESLCKLMSTIGVMIDHPKAKEHMDAYFDMMYNLSNNMVLSSRVRFMLKDVIDLRKNKWQQRRKVEGPKKIEEVHRDAAQERQAQSNRLARGPNMNSSVRRGQGQGQPVDFGPKGSNVLPRGLPQQMRGYGNQDSRFEERHFENRTLSVRPSGDESITLGPQGGLARGMSVRGQPLGQGFPVHERVVPGPNGYGYGPGPGPGPRDDLASRHMFTPRPVFDQSNAGRVQPPTSPPPPRGRVSTPPQSEKVLSEDRLHDKSIEAIKEFYSARDEKEVALCIKDLNAPSFYPSMVSIWVNDSFERKDMERDSLAKLLVNLAKDHDGILSQDSLVTGFESVLSTLEDAVNDAPKAAEFLGRLFARILLENVIPYKEIWRLIYEGGEEQGRLVEIGLAAEVLGVILEIIKSEKGDPFLNEMRAGSNLRVESFRPPPTYKKPSRLDKFI